MLHGRDLRSDAMGFDDLRRHGRFGGTTTAIQCAARDGLPSLDNCKARAE
jgi:hypothetical protein